MGTTLTGTTPQDTYDSLIKVTDNGPLSGSLKTLTDGLGNDSALALSTGAASVTGTLATTAGANFATSSGNVGIGLTSPSQKLEVQSGASGAAIKVSNSGGGSAQLAISSNATSVAELSFTNSLSLTGGNVGIGASSPTAKIQVAGNNGSPIAYLYNNSGAAGQVNGLNVEAGTNSSDYALSVASSLGTSYLRVRGDGNVGIGTNSPNVEFAIYKSSSPRLHLQNSTSGTGSDDGFQIALSGSDGYLWNWQDGATIFATNATERMRIASTGNVGIGESNPSAKLSVTGGNIHSFYTYAGDDANYNIRVGNDLDSSKYGYFYQLGGTTYLANNSYYASAGQFKPTATSASFISQDGENISFSINTGLTVGTNYTPTERARFTANGLTFNGDTAAANALDDYEEGTFTATLVPSISGSITLTAGQQTCKYTKIGNKVSITGFLVVSSVSSPVGGQINLQGLPFTVNNSTSGAGSALVTFFDAPSYTSTVTPSIFFGNTTQINVIRNASLVDASDEFYISATYFV